MAKYKTTTVRLAAEDLQALKRARAAGHSVSDLIRRGLRAAAAEFYSNRRPPQTRLFTSTNRKLGEESELFLNLKR